jgi:cold shock CspA family protein
MSDETGYGFGTCEDGTKVFLHQKYIRMEGYRILFAGDKISFQLKTDERGRAYAANIVKLASRG